MKHAGPHQIRRNKTTVKKHRKENKKAEIIFVLAAEDHEKHLKILNDILKIAENSEKIENLLEAETSEDILQELERILAD